MTPRGLFTLLFLTIFAAGTIALLGRVGAAIGDSITRRSLVEVAERQQRLAHREELHQAQMAEAAALAGTRLQAKKLVIAGSALALVVVVSSVAVGGAWWAIGYGRAQARAAEMKAMLIPVDEKTRMLPLMPFVSGGQLKVYNPNVNAVVLLSDGEREPNPAMIEASSRAQIAGLIGREGGDYGLLQLPRLDS